MAGLRNAAAIASWHLHLARWMFIHIPKNAGVSVRKTKELGGRLLSANPYFHRSRAYTRSVSETMQQLGEHHGFQHARWRDLHPKVTQRLTSVAIVRNPWARTVSRWRFACLAVEQGKAQSDYAAPSFEAFLEERHQWGGREYFWHRAIRGWYPQSDYVTDGKGVIRCDILRLEDLDSEAARYFGLRHPLRKRNLTGRKSSDYRDFYTPQTIQIVADWYASDIEVFGFDFHTPATRNTTYSQD